jgi:hypothetical protein
MQAQLLFVDRVSRIDVVEFEVPLAKKTTKVLELLLEQYVLFHDVDQPLVPMSSGKRVDEVQRLVGDGYIPKDFERLSNFNLRLDMALRSKVKQKVRKVVNSPEGATFFDKLKVCATTPHRTDCSRVAHVFVFDASLCCHIASLSHGSHRSACSQGSFTGHIELFAHRAR